MNITKYFLSAITALALGVAASSLTGCGKSAHDHPDGDHAGHSHGATAGDAKAYPLDKCIVSDEAFNHGEPYAFIHEGQEIKLCCKSCLPDFNKEPAKYLSKLEPAK